MDVAENHPVPLCVGRRTVVIPEEQEAAMRGVLLKTVLAAVVAGSSLLIAGQASAHDYDNWDRWEHRHDRDRDHGRWHDGPRRVVVERPVVIERPVVVARPAPVYVAPVMPAYGGGGGYQEPSVNFNFSFPMR
jgi:Ni/Co efflux regulator RcnB